VLSGCSSASLGAPKLRVDGYDAGLADGRASAVVATEWSTPDDVGVFFRRFYREMQTLGIARTPPMRCAPRRSQRYSRATGARIPAFWAAYFVWGITDVTHSEACPGLPIPSLRRARRGRTGLFWWRASGQRAQRHGGAVPRLLTRVRYYLCRHLGPQDLDDKVHDTFLIVVQPSKKENCANRTA